MWPFNPKQPSLLPAPATRALPAPRDDDEALDLRAAEAKIAQSFAKGMAYDGFGGAFGGDDEGGYYGQEFDIQSTPARIKGLYMREPWIYTAATHIARSLVAVPFKVVSVANETELPTHPLQATINAGTPIQSDVERKWVSYLDLSLGGNSFLLLEPGGKKLAGVAPIETVTPRFKTDGTGMSGIDVAALGESGGGGRSRFFPIEDVVHFKMPNPYSPFYGLSIFLAAARPVLQDRYKNEYDMAFYLRGAMTPGVIETTEDLSQGRFKRLMLTFEQTFTGKANWWKTIFLPKGAAWKGAGLTMVEMQHLESLKENRKTILAVVGIPGSLVGLVEDVNRATAEQQERVYWANTVIPTAQFIAASWNNSYLVKTIYGGKVKVVPDFTGIEAVEGFASIRKERADAMAPYFFIDEIREGIWKAGPLPDGAGQRLVAEVKAPMAPGAFALAAPPPATKGEIPEGFEIQTLVLSKDQFKTAHDAEAWIMDHGFDVSRRDETDTEWLYRQRDPDGYDPETFRTIVLTQGVKAIVAEARKDLEPMARKAARKAAATGSQNRIEAKLSDALGKAVDLYVGDLIGDAVRGLNGHAHLADYLKHRADDRLSAYMGRARETYVKALERGFAAANAQVKRIAPSVKRVADAFLGMDETDREAVDVLRERGRSGRLKVLERRAIERFRGFDATRTEAIVELVAAGHAEGRSFEEIARTLRDDYDEAYRNQARTIVRTEILSAVSEGLAWNHDVLSEVFSEVQKEWLHQGDGDINKDAREEHVAFEELGPIGGDETWKGDDGSELNYPRDPGAPAGQVVNCRCSMISVIPDSATSNADAILESP